MTFEIGLLFFLIAAALALFTWEPWPADVVALGLMIILILTGLVPSEEAFAGFGSDTILLLLGLLILTTALLRTGVVDIMGRSILRRAGANPNRLLLAVMVTVAALSAFMSNTAATALFVPIVLNLARRTGISPSRLLMPLAFASILSSPVTLISSSSNIVISGLMTRYNLPPIGMFELTPVGIPVTIVGIVYMYLIGRRMIPERIKPGEDEPLTGQHKYFTELRFQDGSPMLGKTLAESGLVQELGVTVIRILRNKRPVGKEAGEVHFEPGDVLIVEGQSEEILKIKDIAGVDLKPDVQFTDYDLPPEANRPVEVILLPGSRLVGRTLRRMRFKDRYGVSVLGIHRGGETIFDELDTTPLRVGDQLLVQGDGDYLRRMEDDRLFRLIGEVPEERPNLSRAPLTLVIFAVSLLLAAFNILSLPVAVLTGTLLAFLTRALTPDEAYRNVEWRALILIGSMLSLGSAMDHTGAAEYLARNIVGLVGGASPIFVLGAFFILTVLLTQPMSNQAAAIVVMPVAMQAAVQLQLNPRTFAMMIAVAASCSYLTPLEPSCLMVYRPGRYRFSDFLKVGALLTLLIFAISLVLVPIVWPVTAAP